MTPKSSDFEFWTIKYQKGNGPPPPPNPNYAPKTRLAEVFKTNPVINLFDCQASHEHADDLWACHANPLHRGRIITTRHTRWPSAKREGHDKPWETVLRSLLKYNTIGCVWSFIYPGGWKTVAPKKALNSAQEVWNAVRIQRKTRRR